MGHFDTLPTNCRSKEQEAEFRRRRHLQGLTQDDLAPQTTNILAASLILHTLVSLILLISLQP